jgi:hypothetical protein
MKSAVRCRTAIILASLIAGISLANAAAPVSIDGWRYIKGPDDLHVYICDRSDCVRGSRVICYLGSPNSAFAPGLFRQQESWASEMLGEPIKTLSSLGADFKTGRTHSVGTASDGSKTYHVSGSIDDSRWQAWLSSSSSDAKTSEANLDTFESALRGAKN